MIKVLNRELLIPNNERYLGTTYDTYTAVRMFQLDRVCSDGVDIADLLFKLDLLYPDERTIYTLTSATTITGGNIYVSKISFLKKKQTAGTYTFTYDGSAWTLSGAAATLSEYGIRILDGTPVSGNTITVTLATSTERYDVVNLVKDVTDKEIKLQWTVTENQLAVPGTVYIQIKAYNADGLVRWTSYQAAMFVEDAINAGVHITSLSELVELEATLDKELARLDEEGSKAEQQATAAAASALAAAGSATTAAGSATEASGYATTAAGHVTTASGYATAAAGSATEASGYAEDAEAEVDNCEAWAKGTRDGVPVGTADPAYHNNSKYYSEQSSASATASSTSATNSSTYATNASNSATAAAGKVLSSITENASGHMIATYVDGSTVDLGAVMADGYVRVSNSQPTDERCKVWVYPQGQPTGLVTSVNSRTGAVTLAKSDVGLGNVDNTSDANKPVSTAQQTAIDAKENKGKITIGGTEYTVVVSTTDAGTAGCITFVVEA